MCYPCFMRLRDIVLAYAQEHRLRKLDGHMWRPVAGCPCAYEVGEPYTEFLDDLLNDNAEYHANIRHQDEVVKYLKRFSPPACRNLKGDRNLMSFSDGVLVLSEARFVPYTGGRDPPAGFEGRVARHHIPAPYAARPSHDTPLFDALLLHQMEPAVVHTLHVLLGRLLFPVGALDNWQVMPYLVGLAGAGKSIVLDVVAAMFCTSAAAVLSKTQEAIFGLETKYTKEVIVGRDMPQQLSKVLDATLLQSMVSGEAVSVALKGDAAIDVPKWSVPLIFASNFMPDYIDSAGQISRRIVAFQFPSLVDTPDPQLSKRILSEELPAVVRKVLHAYLGAVRDHGAKGFFNWCPEPLREARKEVRLQTDYLRRFLAAGPLDNASSTVRIYVIQQRDVLTSMPEFEDAFKKYMKFKFPRVDFTLAKKDVSAFTELGYEIETDIKMCKACLKKSKGGKPGVRCCDNYGDANRVNEVFIKHLKIVREAVLYDDFDPLE